MCIELYQEQRKQQMSEEMEPRMSFERTRVIWKGSGQSKPQGTMYSGSRSGKKSNMMALSAGLGRGAESKQGVTGDPHSLTTSQASLVTQ